MNGQTKTIVALTTVILLFAAVFLTWYITSRNILKTKADQPPSAPAATITQTQTPQIASGENQVVSQNQKVSLTLLKGWNFRAVPWVLSPNDGRTLFAGLASGETFYFDAENQKYISLLEKGAITPGQGLVVNSKDGEVLTLPTTAAQVVDETKPFRIALKKNWNLIGNPFNKDIVWNPTIEINNGSKITLDNAQEKNYLSPSYIWSPTSGAYLKVNPGQNIKATQAILIKSGGPLQLIISSQ